ncbi:hypothetical protein [Pseudobacillus wudalianchiensis]|uniref:Uncharacterized protein n=1 Tax=Pseudobacillus wudalianchiensis TaxID=1743143 RepID=A0A1B9B8G4_9BACI|nr:hypothetical protein [Bacillus wudalianchiensis]OCA92394.1 hypothetical protein A8F95_01370 [Bacillus wudalianchiensis]
MTRLVLMLMAFFLAIPILYFLPLGLTITGSFLLLSIALLIAGGSVFMEPYVPLWQNVLVCLLLVAAMAYFLFKYKGHKIMSEWPGNKEESPDEDWLEIEGEMTEKKEEKRLAQIEEPSLKASLFETNMNQTIGQTEQETKPLYIDKEANKLEAGAEQLYEQVELEPAAGKEAVPTEEAEALEADLESLLAREEELSIFDQETPEETDVPHGHEEEHYYLESLFDEIIEEEKHEPSMSRTEEKNLEADREIAFENIAEQEADYIAPLNHLDFDELFEAESDMEEKTEMMEALAPKEDEEAPSAVNKLEEADFLYGEEEIKERLLEQEEFLHEWESEIEEPADSKEIVDTADELTEEEMGNTHQEGDQPLIVERDESAPMLPESEVNDEQPEEELEKHNQEEAQLPTLESEEPTLVLSEAEANNEEQLPEEEELEEHAQGEFHPSTLKLDESVPALPEEAADDEEHLEEEIMESLPEEVERAPLSREWLHIIIQELELKKELWTFAAAEEAIQGYLRAPLNDRDYYTFAKLLLSFYVEKGAFEKASNWTAELKDRFSAYPIIIQELQLVESYIDEKFNEDRWK